MRLALLTLFSASLALGGCVSQPRPYGGQLRTQAPPTVVSLSPSAAEVLMSSLSAHLVGRTSSDDYPTNIASVPVVASVKPDFEKIQSLKPGLVVYDADLYNDADIKRIEGMHVTTFAFSARNLDEFEKQLYELSNKLGGETNVNDYINRIETERKNSEGDKIMPVPKVAVLLGGGSGAYVAGTGSFVADIVKIAGGVLVGPASDRFAPMSPEAMVAAAPDAIVLATSKTEGAKDVAALRADPRLASTPALKNARIIPFDTSIVTRRGGRVETFIRDLHHALAQAVQTKS